MKQRKKIVTAMILTGGTGRRMRPYSYPKQFIKILNKPIFIHTLQLYSKIREVDEVCLVINKKYEKDYLKFLKKFPVKKVKHVVAGGAYRHLSIKNALKHIEHDGIIIVQNGVNPTTPAGLIRKCIKAARKNRAVTAYVSAFHTVFIKTKGRIGRHIPRNRLGYTCEPQVYQAAVLKKAVSRVSHKNAEDVPMIELLERMKCPVHIVPSDMKNFKVTVDSDLKTLEYILKARKK